MKAHVYPRDNINTDEIIPARYLNMHREADLAAHAMEDLDRDFSKKVREGDIIIAGENFGCGSSREHAVWALRGSGIRAVIAGSFARIFYRNCINNGFLAIECQGLSNSVPNGSEMRISTEKGEIKDIDHGRTYAFSPLPEFAKDILKAGGLLNSIKKNSMQN